MKTSSTIGRLLRRNLSKVQLAGFVISNFIGLAIVISAIQFYADIRPIWEGEESFINSDYVIVNKKVGASMALGSSSSDFSEAEIADMEAQPWLRRLGRFSSANYEVRATVSRGGAGLTTNMFLEAIPDSFVEGAGTEWRFQPGDSIVPVIISKDYLTLYNFGFASASGLPQLSEGMLSSIPLSLRLTSRDGARSRTVEGRIVGFSPRLNTILVPEEFMQWSNSLLASGAGAGRPRRLILDVNSPGDVAITDYLAAHSLERSGSDEASRSAFFLRVVAGLVIAIGSVITLLSFFILLLSVALLMQKNRSKLHGLIMLGFSLRAVGAPYVRITTIATAGSYLLAVAAMLIFRNIYFPGVSALGGQSEAGVAVSLLCGAALAALTLAVNILAIRRKVRSAFYS